ncbi:MAG: hypothetical protein WCL50_13370 [Spirochaetota bacterium]
MLGFLAVANGCASVQRNLDDSGLDDIGKRLAVQAPIGGPELLKTFLATFDPFAGEPAELSRLHREPLDLWSMKSPAFPDLVEERLSFPSPLGDRAVFYLYHRGPIVGKKALLWVPGYGVSDFAFLFIENFFKAELEKGYTILFYNLPYHLERRAEGKAVGEGLISLDTITNLRTFDGILADLRAGLAFLRDEKASSVSGWGGSMGAAILWTLSSRERLDHLCLLIPVVDWTTLLFNPRLGGGLAILEGRGFDRALLERAYSAFSPAKTGTLTEPDSIALLYARQDQLTPEARTLAFAKDRSIHDIQGYEQSHTTMLLDSRIYEDYALFLKRVTRPRTANPPRRGWDARSIEDGI